MLSENNHIMEYAIIKYSFQKNKIVLGVVH